MTESLDALERNADITRERLVGIVEALAGKKQKMKKLAKGAGIVLAVLGGGAAIVALRVLDKRRHRLFSRKKPISRVALERALLAFVSVVASEVPRVLIRRLAQP